MKSNLSQVTYDDFIEFIREQKCTSDVFPHYLLFSCKSFSSSCYHQRAFIPSWPLGCSVCGRSLVRSLRWPSRRSLGGQGGWCWRQCWPPCWQLCRSLSWESGRCWWQFCHGEIAFKMLALSASLVVAFDKRRERGLPRDQGAACLRSPVQAH